MSVVHCQATVQAQKICSDTHRSWLSAGSPVSCSSWKRCDWGQYAVSYCFDWRIASPSVPNHQDLGIASAQSHSEPSAGNTSGKWYCHPRCLRTYPWSLTCLFLPVQLCTHGSTAACRLATSLYWWVMLPSVGQTWELYWYLHSDRVAVTRETHERLAAPSFRTSRRHLQTPDGTVSAPSRLPVLSHSPSSAWSSCTYEGIQLFAWISSPCTGYESSSEVASLCLLALTKSLVSRWGTARSSSWSRCSTGDFEDLDRGSSADGSLQRGVLNFVLSNCCQRSFRSR